VRDLTAEAASEMGLRAGEGLLVSAVERNSPAARAGLARGHVIQAIDGQVPEGVTGAAKLLYPRQAGDRVELTLAVSEARGHFLRVFSAKAVVAVR
jgi:S1-C subfamily serine protease